VALCEALQENATLTELNLRLNGIQLLGQLRLAEALRTSGALRALLC
jgi:hypothetical protein